MHPFLSRKTLSAPSFDLLDVAPMPLCREDFVVEEDMNLIDSMAKSMADGVSLLMAIIAPTVVIHFECVLVALCPLTLSPQHIVVAKAMVLDLLTIRGALHGTIVL